LFAFGGQRNTAFLSLSGDACALVPDWARFSEIGRDVLAGRLTRWDGAADDFAGAHTVDLAVEMYLQGGFTGRGRQPGIGVAGDWLGQTGLGRTLYIGNRKNGKLLRIYEKGKQLGQKESPWVRWEVEYHNKNRVIPWDVLTLPDCYAAGAYPCMSWVGQERSRIGTVKAQDAISYERMKRSASTGYGRLSNVMMEREGSAERVIAQLLVPGAPRRLAFSAQYLREHSDGPDV